MAQATLKKVDADPMRGRVIHLLREGAGLLVLAVALLLLLSLLSYDPGDPGWSHTGTHSTVPTLVVLRGRGSPIYCFTCSGISPSSPHP